METAVFLLVAVTTFTAVFTPPVAAILRLPQPLCQEEPTHILCNKTIPNLHLIQGTTVIKHCNIFDLTLVHCCEGFCDPGSGGTCNQATGACDCEGTGKPDHCPVLTIEPGEDGYEEYQQTVATECGPKCQNSSTSCKNATAVSAGILGTVCLCYCP